MRQETWVLRGLARGGLSAPHPVEVQVAEELALPEQQLHPDALPREHRGLPSRRSGQCTEPGLHRLCCPSQQESGPGETEHLEKSPRHRQVGTPKYSSLVPAQPPTDNF